MSQSWKVSWFPIHSIATVDGKHKKVIKATAKDIVKKFLENMNDQRENVKEQRQAIFSDFPIEGSPNVIIEDQTYVLSTAAVENANQSKSKMHIFFNSISIRCLFKFNDMKIQHYFTFEFCRVWGQSIGPRLAWGHRVRGKLTSQQKELPDQVFLLSYYYIAHNNFFFENC